MQSKKKLILSLLVGLGAVFLGLPLTVGSANLLQNDGLEAPFEKYGEWTGGGVTFDLEVAHDWERFFVPEATEDDGDKLRYFRASAVEFLFGYTEKRDGADAQLWWSTKPYDAGIYQQVSGLTIGETYGFQAGILQVYGSTTSITHNKMFRSVGIDPYGGADPTGPNVVWSPEEGLDVDWFYPGVGMQAMSSTMTVFIRVRSPHDSPQFEENSVWADDTFLDIAPTTSLTLTVDSPTLVSATWSGTPRPDFHLFAYEAQYRDAGAETWTDLQIFDSSTDPVPTDAGASFAVEAGKQYVVRARTWHEQNGGDSHEAPGPWVEQTITVGGLISGKTLDHQANALSDVTVTVGGSAQTTISDDLGQYNLLIGSGAFSLTAEHSSGWTTPQPINVTVPSLGSVVPLSITLRPPDDVIANGDFENGPDGLANWQVSGGPPGLISTGQRSGNYSLALSGTLTLSQTSLISNGIEPVFSFWYKIDSGDGDDVFTAEILGAGDLTPTGQFSTTTVGDWQHAWLPLDLGETYSGPVGVRFELNQLGPTQTLVYLDEVSVGSSFGETAEATFLPVIFK